MRRAFNFVIDAVDGILAAVLYSRQGSLPYTLHDLENLNESKLRQWSAGSPSAQHEAGVNATEDLEARIRAFGARAPKIEKR